MASLRCSDDIYFGSPAGWCKVPVQELKTAMKFGCCCWVWLAAEWEGKPTKNYFSLIISCFLCLCIIVHIVHVYLSLLLIHQSIIILYVYQ